MSKITASEVNNLRKTTGAGMMDCKKALVESDGNFEKAIEILTQKKIGSLDWIEYRDLKQGAEAFKQIHNGSCIAPKIILIP